MGESVGWSLLITTSLGEGEGVGTLSVGDVLGEADGWPLLVGVAVAGSGSQKFAWTMRISASLF
jgi:hypothetical protein